MICNLCTLKFKAIYFKTSANKTLEMFLGKKQTKQQTMRFSLPDDHLGILIFIALFFSSAASSTAKKQIDSTLFMIDLSNEKHLFLYIWSLFWATVLSTWITYFSKIQISRRKALQALSEAAEGDKGTANANTFSLQTFYGTFNRRLLFVIRNWPEADFSLLYFCFCCCKVKNPNYRTSRGWHSFPFCA